MTTWLSVGMWESPEDGATLFLINRGGVDWPPICPCDAEGRILVAALRIRGAGRLAEIIRHGFGQVSVRLLSRVYRDEEFVVDDLVIMESDDAAVFS